MESYIVTISVFMDINSIPEARDPATELSDSYIYVYTYIYSTLLLDTVLEGYIVQPSSLLYSPSSPPRLSVTIYISFSTLCAFLLYSPRFFYPHCPSRFLWLLLSSFVLFRFDEYNGPSESCRPLWKEASSLTFKCIMQYNG